MVRRKQNEPQIKTVSVAAPFCETPPTNHTRLTTPELTNPNSEEDQHAVLSPKHKSIVTS